MAAAKRFMVEELRREREASSLNISELTTFVDGGEMFSEKRRGTYPKVIEDPVFSMANSYFMSREESFDDSMKKSVRYVQRKKELALDPFESRVFKELAGATQFVLNVEAFIPTIQGQGTPEQQEKWLSLAKDYKIIGAYAQTELGHGTYLRGLETIATYDPSRQEFVLDSPTLTATKWWPGSLGHTATHTVVVARLIIKGVDRGPHSFIVQLRSLEDHTPLPGIEVGDIGPKYGYFGMDNGFLRMDKIRIPRDQMLMKYSKVLPDGTFVKPPVAKAAYGTMVGIRCGIVIYSGRGLARAVTIATRYSVVRRQGESSTGGPEVQVMDYQTQQHKLLPLIATAYALISTGQFMLRMYMQIQSEIMEGNFSSLPELHATSSGLKAFCSFAAAQGIELCRLACGGHGYSLASGIPHIFVQYAPAMTYEGENTVLYLQTARYLNKLYSQKLPSSGLADNVAYLASNYTLQKRSPVRTAQQFLDPHVLLEAYRQRARRMVAIAVTRFENGKRSGLSQSDAWSSSTCDWITASNAHCHYVVLKSFYSAVQSSDLTGSNRAMMDALCALYGVFGITKYSGEFMTDGYMSSEQVALARDQLYSLLSTVRKEAVPLVDAFDFPDETLNSALGRYDGDVYTHLYKWAQRAPRNKKKVHDVYEKYLKGMLKQTKAKL
ncbi:peroxisomal acyl-coenzyme A oxidase 1-like isoform X2 [Halichondria panicea]|uniref:peroxisomal acyl-coenzyme A oxidase 1-like isoform X2 n=1 Tax=Halichondria panicea TaxID=6063 RepID=UPI00312B6367